MSRFVRIFENVWSARHGGDEQSIAELLDVLPDLFHPSFTFLEKEAEQSEVRHEGAKAHETREASFARLLRMQNADHASAMRDWLDWLAGWTALVPFATWSLDKRRRVITRLLPLYRKRGTREGLQGLLRLLFDKPLHVLDDVQIPAFRVGGNARVGGRAAIGGFPADYFIVVIRISEREQHRVADLAREVRRIVDDEKPVQTKYGLVFQIHEHVPGFTVAVSRLGVNTVLLRRGGDHGRAK